MRGLPTRRTNRRALWAILLLAAVITWAPLHSLDDEARVSIALAKALLILR